MEQVCWGKAKVLVQLLSCIAILRGLLYKGPRTNHSPKISMPMHCDKRLLRGMYTVKPFD